MNQVILVACGGALGACLRHGANLLAARLMGGGFPWATFTVNVVGSLAMGCLAGWLMRRAGGEADASLRLFIGTGLLGGFTTFSAFSLDAAQLWQRGATTHAAIYVFGSVVLSLAAVFAGLALMRGQG
ncbi:MAG: fluoride efflux transporter CrcB [Rhizobiaceae bacterium]|jgi:CrcB protein|nr:fluoride efflux transporter CrcB [Rhizobiaceae bacterium]